LDLRDKGACPAAQAARARARLGSTALALALALSSSCSGHKATPPLAAHSAPARDVIVRTGRFAIHVNAYVTYYAAEGVAAEDKSEGGAEASLDAAFLSKLGACSDDPCAVRVLGPSHAAKLGAYLEDHWTDDSDDAQRSVGRVASPVLTFEDLVAPTLASQIGRVWPSDPVDVFVARAQRVDPSGRTGPLLDTQGECFAEGALLECLLTRAVEELLPESDVGRAITEARAKLDDAGREKCETAIACVAALSVDAAVTAALHHYQPTRRFAEACPASLRSWLADNWMKRMKNEIEAKAFGAALVEAMAR
jgi:hypothetical protein